MSTPPFSPDHPLRIGTRRSPLAMAQAHMVADAIRVAHSLPDQAVILAPMLASGDKIQDRPLAEIGGKALWTKELERALIDNDIDIAVHSMKDVETQRPDSFTIAAMLPRADVRDRFLGVDSVAALPQRARVGTSSPRRAAQLLHLRPDLEIVPLRGNVQTRMAKLEAGEADATLLAAAGLDRLEMGDIGHAIELDDMLPAASQGAIGIDRLSAREDLQALLDAINDSATFVAVMAERAFLAALGGTCHSPVAALAQVQDGSVLLKGQILSGDGQESHAGEQCFAIGDDTGPTALAAELMSRASDAVKTLFGY